MASCRNGTLYCGITSNLQQRVFQHKNNLIDGFTKKYGCKILVYYEQYGDIVSAIIREKQIKHYKRTKKLLLIESMNPNWDDLYEKICS